MDRPSHSMRVPWVFTFAAVLGGVAIVGVGSARAGGFQITEQSVAGLGRAFAGAGIVGDDASAVFFNPAAMTLLRGTKLDGGFAVIAPSARFRGTSTRTAISTTTGLPIAASTVATGDADPGTTAVVPHFYATTSYFDPVVLGIGVTAPFGLSLSYPEGWVGRYHALKSRLATYDINPAIAYRINDHVSIGGGVSAQYADVALSQAVFTGTATDGLAKVTGDDWSYGWSLGALFELNRDVRFGVGFRSKVRHTLHGERRLSGLGPRNGTVGAEATTTFPEQVDAESYTRLTDQLALAVGVRWTNWSRFKDLAVRFADGTSQVTPEDWNDSWTARIGVEYDVVPATGPAPRVVVRTGYAYDQTPVRDRFLRTPRIPDATRHWLSFGASWRPTEHVNVDLGYTHLFASDVKIVNTTPIAQPAPGTAVADQLSGTVDTSGNIFGAQATLTF